MVENVDAPILQRPIITLIVFAFLAALLIFRFSLSLSAELMITNTLDFDFPLLNSTLAELAQSDPSDDSLQKDIALLLKGDLDNIDLRSWRRPVDIRSPAFRSLYNLRFLPLLSNWSSSRRQSLPAEDTLSHLLPGLLGRSHKYSSCAVVGNSGILLNSNHGPSIDSHEAVIRLNNARITPFPNHVGTKTTLSFVNSNILHLCAHGDCSSCHPYGPSVPLLLYICQPIHFLDFAACNNSTTFHVTNPAFDLLCSKIVKYYSLRRWFSSPDPQLQNRTLQGWFAAHDGIMFHYSSGMQAVMTAVGVCESVSLFGFGKAANAKHHYHTNQRAELDLHDYEAEYELYHDLAERQHTIPFLFGIHLPPVQIYH